MKKDSDYTDSEVNAFVDGELSTDERLALLDVATRSDGLKQRICDAQYLKEQLRGAYPLIHERAPLQGRRKFLEHGVAAAVGGFAVLAGVQLTGQGRDTPLLANRIDADTTRVVFHSSSNDVELAEQLLDQVEFVLDHYSAAGNSLRVEVVTNNQGLRLLQKGRSFFPERISQLDQRYQNLMFAACGNTMERFSKKYGETIEVLPEAVVIRSGVSFVTRRQQQGWAYIKV